MSPALQKFCNYVMNDTNLFKDFLNIHISISKATDLTIQIGDLILKYYIFKINYYTIMMWPPKVLFIAVGIPLSVDIP